MHPFGLSVKRLASASGLLLTLSLALGCGNESSSAPVLRVGGVAVLNPSAPLPVGARPALGCGELASLDAVELQEAGYRPVRSDDSWLQFMYDAETGRARWRIYDAASRTATEFDNDIAPADARLAAAGLSDGEFVVAAFGTTQLVTYWVEDDGALRESFFATRQDLALDELPWLSDERRAEAEERLLEVPEPFVVPIGDGAWLVWQEPSWEELAANGDLSPADVPDRIWARWLPRDEEAAAPTLISEEALDGEWINAVGLGNVFRLSAGQNDPDRASVTRLAAFAIAGTPQVFAFGESVSTAGEYLFAASDGQVHAFSLRDQSGELVALYEAGDLQLSDRERAVLIEPEMPISRIASVDADASIGFVSYEVEALRPILRGAFIDADENVEVIDIMEESETRTYSAYPVWSAETAFVLINEHGGIGYLDCEVSE